MFHILFFVFKIQNTFQTKIKYFRNTKYQVLLFKYYSNANISNIRIFQKSFSYLLRTMKTTLVYLKKKLQYRFTKTISIEIVSKSMIFPADENVNLLLSNFP